MSKQLKADLSLLIVTLSWGASFILTKNSLNALETYNFLAIRFFIAFALSSLLFYKNMKRINKATLKYGTIIGIILFSAFAFETVGLNYTTASKSAFITGFSVVLVPMLSAVLLKKAPQKQAVVGACIAFIGLALLSLNGSLAINIGDFYTLIASFGFAFHIIFIDKYIAKIDSIALAIIQIGVVAILSFFTSLAIETPIIPSGEVLWVNIFILSIVCTSGAFIIQNAAQKYTTPTHTALIYTTEPVFAATFGYFMAGEILSLRGFLGAILILFGMLVAEIDIKSLFNKKDPKNKDFKKAV
ncbi:DMT family transporter [Tepidibacter hydrothermalis]|uniref:DMT family transporter n=1 Tax=Tepidibacter hydrothermalis TaxID=3036126 RepID=A0ABY8EE06_9FIRM|nr:DMT family transporter [Tepidibacter hydrothermalis]WFD09717.1 DMT family transporter [Tepidibacter hydrothermalis]